jgi:hypothetical protein
MVSAMVVRNTLFLNGKCYNDNWDLYDEGLELEETKGVIRTRKSKKDRQHNVQKK